MLKKRISNIFKYLKLFSYIWKYFQILENGFQILENEFQIFENEFQIFENEFQILQNTDFCTHWLAIERRFKGKVNQQIHTIS